MTAQEAKDLLIRYELGKCTAEEASALESWYGQLIDQSDLSIRPEDNTKYHQQILEQINSGIERQERKTRKLWLRIIVAAAAVAAITAGTWLYMNEIGFTHSPQELASLGSSQVVNDIAPGRNTATLSLSNGMTIKLDTNKTSVVVTDSVKTTMMLTASTPRGGTYQVVLPDGTKVWLNAASSIRFPSSFAGQKQRRVEITGEVYLEVHKDHTHPFIAESRGQYVEVLGTHFNINSYSDEGVTKTTLLEGSVRVASLIASNTSIEQSRSLILKPSQQSILSGDSIKVKQANIEEELAWKNGDFIFDGEDFRAAMRKVGRWYDVEIVYDASVPHQVKLGGWISRSKHLSAVLKVLESTGEIHFSIQGRRILVKK